MVFWSVRHEIESTVMLCRICDAELPDEVGFCPGCGAVNVQRLRTSGPAPRLDKESKALVHWLAQAHRRLTYPIDGAEESRYSVMEYSWRVFNNRYRKLSPNGKEMKAANKYIKRYLDKSWFEKDSQPRIVSLCKTLLPQESDATIPPEITSIDDFKRPAEAIKELYEAYESAKPRECANKFVYFIYQIRNLRFHGHLAVLSARGHAMPIPGNPVAWTETFLGLIEHLIGAELQISPEDLRRAIDSELFAMLDEIHNGVMGWKLGQKR
jgi:hypothetical protein